MRSAVVIHYYLGGMAFARAGALDAVSSVEAWTLAIAGGATIAGQGARHHCERI